MSAWSKDICSPFRATYAASKVITRPTNRLGVFTHEAGHGLDAALKYISQTPEFLICVAADIEKFDALNRAIYRYLLQPMPTGPSEIFAECYGATQGQCAVVSHVKDMPIYFPQSFRFVQELVAKLCFTLP